MNPFILLYNELLFRPLFNLLVGITVLLPTHNVGLAIILVTIIVRLILLPSSLHQARQMQRNQTKMADVKGEIDKIQKKYKNDRAKAAQATMEVYRRAGINPASGCLPLLIQLPILIALYRVFLIGIGPETFDHLYSFVSAPETVSLVFLGIDLTTPSAFLAILAGLAQFVLMRYFTPTPTTQPGANESSQEMMRAMQRNMTYFFPVMTVFIGFQFVAALSLYWVASTVFAVAQQYIIKRKLKLEGNPTVV